MVGGNVHILVVEDNAVQASVLQRLLLKHDYKVTLAFDGQQAWDFLQDTPDLPALVISDIEMPDLDGYELCRKLKTDQRYSHTPVILLTNLDDPLYIVSGIEAGADNYITKPFAPQLLLKRISSLLASPELYQNLPNSEVVNFQLENKDFAIRANHGQLLNLLLSTFEGAVWQNQQLRQSNQQLSQAHNAMEKLINLQNEFLGMVTHDMRNPLGVILAYARLLSDEVAGPMTERQAKYCEAIHHSSKSLLALVNNLLDISEIESGKLQLTLQETDLKALLERALELNSLLAEEKNIQLEATLATIPPIYLDTSKIEQVINNLLSNAIKYSFTGSKVKVTLSLLDSHYLEFSVIDHGQGILAQEQSKIFQHYQRSSTKATAGEKSTGLGLAIVKRIVEGHGGNIRLSSQLGQGSTFTVSLPLAANPPTESPENKISLQQSGGVIC